MQPKYSPLPLCTFCYNKVDPRAKICPACNAERMTYHRATDLRPWALIGVFIGIMFDVFWLGTDIKPMAKLLILPCLGGGIAALIASPFIEKRHGWERSSRPVIINVRNAPPPPR